MRISKTIVAILACIGTFATSPYNLSAKPHKKSKTEISNPKKWLRYDIGDIEFADKARHTKGSEIYHRIIPDPKKFISKCAREVLATLYFSPRDKVEPVESIYYTLEDKKGISAKSGKDGRIRIFYSTRHIESSHKKGGDEKVLFETRGVLLHELTHAYQLRPQGIGTYSTNRVNWTFVESMADAVRIANNGFHGEKDRPKGGHYSKGYRYGGYFLVWIRDNYDKDFLRKFNLSTLSVIPWSFDGAIKHILGEKYSIEELWREYQIAVGDIVD